MTSIQVMDPHLAAKIAAGEVIERPASVVRELVENALDADATWVRVEIEDGGVERISVSDDGSGIPSGEVELAFRRHATSKLLVEEDLNRLRTLGFRGEALPSIAAVADVTCTTSARSDVVGTELRIEEGALSNRSLPRQPGTTLVVDGLFARFPARKKFLRARATEATACVQALQPLALAFPEVRFTLLSDGREVLRTPGDGRLRSAALAILGTDADAALIGIDPPEENDEQGEQEIRVRGLAGTGNLHRSNRSGVFLLVNHRPVQNRALSFAVTEAYGSLIPVGRHPVAIVQVEVPPDEVDFNVHPSKLEVKLLRERAVYGAIQRSIRNALGRGGWDVAAWAPPTPTPTSTGAPVSAGEWRFPLADEGSPPKGHLGGSDEDLLSGGEQLQSLRILGQAGRTYVIAEGDAGVYLVDQHAAHERVLLEEFRESLVQRTERQLLLEPRVLDVPTEAAALGEEVATDLAALGFEVEPFGPNQLLLRAVPAIIASRNPSRVLSETLTAITANSHGLAFDPQADWHERLALVLACKTAVRAGDFLEVAEMQSLVRRLGEATLCRTCAHGRPTAILLSHAHLERQFGRR